MSICRVCNDKGMIPECPVCFLRKSSVEAKRRGAIERQRMLAQAWTAFNRLGSSSGSGIKEFDADVKETFGDWK